MIRIGTLIYSNVGAKFGYAPAQITLTDGPNKLVQAVGPGDAGMFSFSPACELFQRCLRDDLKRLKS